MATAQKTRPAGRAVRRSLAKRKATEPIKPNEMLLLSDFLERTHQGRHAWMTAQRAAASIGITLAFPHGRQLFVSTDAWIAYLTHPSRGTSNPDSESGSPTTTK